MPRRVGLARPCLRCGTPKGWTSGKASCRACHQPGPCFMCRGSGVLVERPARERLLGPYPTVRRAEQEDPCIECDGCGLSDRKASGRPTARLVSLASLMPFGSRVLSGIKEMDRLQRQQRRPPRSLRFGRDLGFIVRFQASLFIETLLDQSLYGLLVEGQNGEPDRTLYAEVRATFPFVKVHEDETTRLSYRFRGQVRPFFWVLPIPYPEQMYGEVGRHLVDRLHGWLEANGHGAWWPKIQQDIVKIAPKEDRGVMSLLKYLGLMPPGDGGAQG